MIRNFRSPFAMDEIAKYNLYKSPPSISEARALSKKAKLYSDPSNQTPHRLCTPASDISNLDIGAKAYLKSIQFLMIVVILILLIYCVPYIALNYFINFKEIRSSEEEGDILKILNVVFWKLLIYSIDQINSMEYNCVKSLYSR